MSVSFWLNQRLVFLNPEPGEVLLDTLRTLGLKSVRRGCDQISCGVCTVLLEGNMVPSCSVLTVRIANQHVTTVEGIETEAKKIASYFGSEGADQCGFCNPALALAVYSLKQRNPQASLDEIKEYLVGNLCRCTGYQSQHIAIQQYLQEETL